MRFTRFAWFLQVCVCLFYAISSISVCSASSSKYIWPLSQNYGVSATFGEYRDDHFHAGIDVSTNGETGLPVMAIADGTVYRLRITRRGYGRALYLRHTDGMVSVYGHLESFSTNLGIEQQYQKRVAEQNNRYVGDVFLEPPITVHQGEVIAYSGESGAGLPHLHLELRKTEAVALNPLTNGFQDTLDPEPPVFQACYLYPLDADSAVDEELDTKEFRLFKQDSGYRANETPVVHGNFLLSVSAYDPSLRPYRRSPQRVTYSIDDQTVYSLSFDQVSYSDPEPFGLVYDLGKPGPSYYEYPYILGRISDVGSPFGSGPLSFYTNRLRPGLHRLKIDATDTNQNTSSAFLDFIVDHPPQVDIDRFSLTNTELTGSVRISDPDWQAQNPPALSIDAAYSLDDGKTFVPFPNGAMDLSPAKQTVIFNYRVPRSALAASLPARIYLKARGYDGIEYSFTRLAEISTGIPVTTAEVHPQGTVQISKYTNTLKVTFQTAQLMPGKIEMQAGSKKYEMQSRDLHLYEAVIPAPAGGGRLQLILPDQQQLTIPVTYLERGAANQDRKSTRLNSSHHQVSRMPSSA